MFPRRVELGETIADTIKSALVTCLISSLARGNLVADIDRAAARRKRIALSHTPATDFLR
jgi:hypothetical protein